MLVVLLPVFVAHTRVICGYNFVTPLNILDLLVDTLSQKWNFPSGISSVMWPNSQFSADLVIFTEEIVNGKLHFCAVTPGTKGLTMRVVLPDSIVFAVTNTSSKVIPCIAYNVITYNV